MTRPSIRWMLRLDVSDVLDIEIAAKGDDAWDARDLQSFLRGHNAIGMVATDRDGRVVGHMEYRLGKHLINLVNLVVSPDRWGEGIGRAMVNEMSRKLSKYRRTRAECTVGDWDLDAHLFLRATGWRAYVLDCSTYCFVLVPSADSTTCSGRHATIREGRRV